MTVGAQSSEAVSPRAKPGWLGRALVLVLGLSVVLSWMAIQAMLVFTQAVWLASTGQVFAGAEPGRIAAQMRNLRLVLAVVSLGAAILFVGWIHRAHGVLAALGSTGAGSARDSVRACLIPGVNLVRVPSIVARLWRASGVEPPASVSTWVAWWWALCLATVALDLSAVGWLGPGAWLSLRMLAECARIAAALLTIVIVMRIERFLRERSAASTASAGTVAGA
jgi:hypothetical protein